MNKKKLKDNIKRIYNVILLLASVGILGAAVMIIHENEEKSIAEQKQYETISVQMIEKQLNISEDFIYNLVANNTDYPVITSENDNQRTLATVYKGNIIKNLIMDCQSYTKYRPNETTGGIFVSWRRKEELPTGA